MPTDHDAGRPARAGMTTVLCVPQWQGSASGRAPRLAAGARRAAELVHAEAVVTVPVLEIPGETAAGVRALDVLVRAPLGDGPAGLTPDRPLAPRQVIVAGERAGDASEHEYLARTGLRRHGVEDLERVLEGLRRLGATLAG
ncbi:hypothetical protein [Streptomyces sp. NBC_01198]|uniref:hypothetical protein n=1 Tax=Streptomyces sp. NBC_01198 TaxID=2903769 RepID=UPI002E0DD91D|nr:hypothetical protein OG702_03620 [Streptomyces sp. NBC_01198]